MKQKNPIFFLVRSWNSFQVFDRCIDSILEQNTSDYTIIYVDDNSEYTKAQKAYIQSKLKKHITIFNKHRNYSLKNAYQAIHTHVDNPEAIMVNVDGDDWLLREDVIKIITNVYNSTDSLLTYGSCVIFDGPNKPYRMASDLGSDINKRYPINIEKSRTYRVQSFRPLALRTWKAGLFKKIPLSYFLRPDGSWIRYCEDEAIFLSLLELAGGKYQALSQPLYVYDKHQALNDSKVNFTERVIDEVCIRRKEPLLP